MVIDTDEAGVQGGIADFTRCLPAPEFVSPTCPGRTSMVLMYVGPMWSPLPLG